MELNRISSHLVGIATGRHGARRDHRDAVRLPRARVDPRPLRDDHRPADEPRLHPARAAWPRTCRRARSSKIARVPRRSCRSSSKTMRKLLTATDLELARTKDVGFLDLTGCMALGVTGPMLRSAGLPWDLRKTSRTAATRPTTSTCRPQTDADVYGRYLVRLAEMRRVAEDHRAVRSTGCGQPRPGHGRGQEDRLAGAARARRRRHGQLARPHRADHGPVDGGADPPLQAGHRGLPGAAGPGLRGRRVARAASSAATWSPTAAPGRTGCTSATRRSSTCRPCRRWPRAA